MPLALCIWARIQPCCITSFWKVRKSTPECQFLFRGRGNQGLGQIDGTGKRKSYSSMWRTWTSFSCLAPPPGGMLLVLPPSLWESLKDLLCRLPAVAFRHNQNFSSVLVTVPSCSSHDYPKTYFSEWILCAMPELDFEHSRRLPSHGRGRGAREGEVEKFGYSSSSWLLWLPDYQRRRTCAFMSRFFLVPHSVLIYYTIL